MKNSLFDSTYVLLLQVILILIVFGDCEILSVESNGVLGSVSPIVPNIGDKFKITKNSIIRTHDSRALGAKYLNETEFSSNQDCLQWCWNTNSCNLAVFEEKVKGSCYLFDCGPSNDFKCRFTPHSFYSSSLLQVNRNSYLLNEWKNQSNQEKELTNLAGKKLQIQNISPTTNSPKVSKCRHYQFECATSNECIAIYNVCDGIPQCSDGSDEAHELECHKSRLSSSVDSTTSPQPEVKIASNENTQIKPSSLPSSVVSSSNTANQVFESLRTQPDLPIHPDKHSIPTSGNSGHFLNLNYPHSSNSISGTYDENWISNNRINQPAVASNDYPNNYQSSWNTMPLSMDKQTLQQSQPSGQSVTSPGLMFSNDANQIMSENALKESLYWPVLNRPQVSQNTALSSPQNLLFPHSGYNNAQLNDHQTELMNEIRSNRFESLLKPIVPSIIKPELNMINQQQSLAETSALKSTSSPLLPSIINTTQQSNIQNNNRLNESTKTNISQRNESSKQYSNILSHTREQVHLSSVIAVTHLHDSNAQNGRETNSAVIALTLGLFITGILIFLVGCRMKSFKKRVARRGRSLAHDADYLINGMYL